MSVFAYCLRSDIEDSLFNISTFGYIIFFLKEVNSSSIV